MKKTINIFKYIFEFSIPVIFSFAIVTVADERQIYVEEYVFPIQILYFIILFLEWIRRYKNNGEEKFYEKYLWLIAIFIVFYFSIDLLKLFPLPNNAYWK